MHLKAGSPTTRRLLSRGSGQAWGILRVAPAGITLVQQKLHLKKLLRVESDGKILAFRYDDQRVLNVYLPTCTEEEWRTVLGPLGAMIAETDDDAGLRVFSGTDPALQVRDYALGQPVSFER